MSIAGSGATQPLSGPCAPARAEVDSRCAEAERLAQAAVAHRQRLRDIRIQLNEMVAVREADARVRDRRQLIESKDGARGAYSTQILHARNQGDVREAARVWLREIDRLNRQISRAERRAVDVTRQANDLERALPGIELAADVARIAAETAQVACFDARRALAACEEDAQQRIQRTTPARLNPAKSRAAPSAAAGSVAPSEQSLVPPISLVLQGDRDTLRSLSLRLADETGVDAGRLQLLLLELREQIASSALEENFLQFPDSHPFWSQLPRRDGRQVAASLSSMGFRFDGSGAWLDDHSPTIRELALAISHVGIDPRSMRRPPDLAAVGQLWLGTTVSVEEYVATKAPDLELEQVINCLGARAGRLSELWDLWGRLRPLLLTPA